MKATLLALPRYRLRQSWVEQCMIHFIRRKLNGVSYVTGRKSKYANGRTYSFPDLIAEAQSTADFPSVADANDDSFWPQTVGEIIQCVYCSLSKCNKEAIEGLSQFTRQSLHQCEHCGRRMPRYVPEPDDRQRYGASCICRPRGGHSHRQPHRADGQLRGIQQSANGARRHLK